jgi:hypothetical protein
MAQEGLPGVVLQCSTKNGGRIDKPAPRVYRAGSEIFSVQKNKQQPSLAVTQY